MNLKKLFSFQDGLTSFTYPVVKIVISLALLISAMLCARVADISNPLANLAFKVLYCVVAMACILSRRKQFFWRNCLLNLYV